MDYDLSIIGAGWAGFNSAIKAKELGLRVALIEKEQIGGICLNRGCIPTKTLIHSAKIYTLLKKSQAFGIVAPSLQVNFEEIHSRKERIIQKLRKGMELNLRGIDFFPESAQILSANRLKVSEKNINTKFILIASGSKPQETKDLKFDKKKIISSDEILNLKEIPKSLLVIGGGVIGCEFASLFSIFGSQVSIVEKLPQLLPSEDREIAKKLENIFKKKGIKVNIDTNAQTIDLSVYDLVLLCIGRIPNTQDLSLDKIGLNCEKGRIVVDEFLKTNIPNIYAAGDCIGGAMLAHSAAYQGTVAIENIANPNLSKRYSDSNIPNCIYTDPEIARVGLTEEKAELNSFDIKVHKFDFLGSGMAHILDETEGFLKIISQQKTERILGASIIGPRATELIGILTLAISAELKVSQIKETVFAHPTLSESVGDALKRNYGI